MRGALLSLALCVAVALGGCGGGSDDTSTSSAAESTPTTSAVQPEGQGAAQQSEGKSAGAQSAKGSEHSSAKGNSKPEGSQKQSGDSSSHPHRTKVPRISSAPIAGSSKPAPGVKTVKDGDNSVQEYGVESGSSERREAAIALQAYLNARAEGDWSSACALLATKPMEQLERVQQAAAKQGQKLNGCAQTLALLREGEAQEESGTKITEVLSLRGGGDIAGDPSYLIYVAPPGRTFFSMPMYLEGGTWKVGLARAAELPLG